MLTACQLGEGSEPEPFVFESRPAVIVRGEDWESQRFDEFADSLGVPRATAAVFDDGQVIRVRHRGEGVDENALFQAASMSKAVAAAGIVTYAMDRGIGLDDDLAPLITSLDLQAIEGVDGPVTLRALLSHTAGATVSGFPGYAAGSAVPSNLEVVLGSGSANTEPVALTKRKGRYSYSGGGFQIAQLFVEDHSGRPFAEVMEELVLAPLGMTRSSFSQPIDPDRLEGVHIVPAELGDGPLEGGWHTYPELASAGLWTTAEDYGKFAVAVGRAYRGETDAGLRPEVARAMLTPVDKDYGLGLQILSREGKPVSFSHGGSNAGYKAFFRGSALEADAVVVLTNHPAGSQFANDIVRGSFARLAADGIDEQTLARVAMSEETRARCLGPYAPDGGDSVAFSLTVRNGQVFLSDEGGDEEVIHTGDGQFVLRNGGYQLECLKDERGAYLLAGQSLRFDRITQGEPSTR
jgi:CubicO group peptidase (beta-lactamase class C family)